MNAAEVRSVPDVRPERAGGWGRKALIPALLIVVVAAGATWMNVVRTIRDPDPLAIPERPPIAGVVWANRVFIHERSLKRWLETRGHSYAVWARKHPRAVAVLRDQPLPPVTVASRKPNRVAAGAAVAASDDLGLTTLALIVAGLLGAMALLLVAARRAVVVVADRSSGLPRIDARSVGRRFPEAWQGLARTVLRTVNAARAGMQALSERLASRWTDGQPSVHPGPSVAAPLRERLTKLSADARTALRRSPEDRGPGVKTRLAEWWAATQPALRPSPEDHGSDRRTRIAEWWADARPAPRGSEDRGPGFRTRLAEWWEDVGPGSGVRDELDDGSLTGRMQRLYDGFADALEALRDYRLRVAFWALTAVIAAAGITFLISQATQP